VVSDERGVQIRVTASLGLAVLRPGETLEQLLHRADGAMYASKAAGRNRVTAHGEDSARAAE
jgi:diguanylate cyclase (GGDEF)-like protein